MEGGVVCHRKVSRGGLVGGKGVQFLWVGVTGQMYSNSLFMEREDSYGELLIPGLPDSEEENGEHAGENYD